MRPHGTKTWRVEYIFNGARTKYTIGAYDREAVPGESITEWLRHGRLSLAQARAIAGNRKDARRAGHDPAAEWESLLAQERAAEAAIKAAEEAEAAQPTVRQAAEVWRAPDDSEYCKADPITIAAMKLLILTGQREREVPDAEWTEFDPDAGLWRIPAARTKKERAHLVHLAPQAVAILEGLKPLSGKGRHAFPSPLKPKQPIYGRSVNNARLTLFNKGALPPTLVAIKECTTTPPNFDTKPAQNPVTKGKSILRGWLLEQGI